MPGSSRVFQSIEIGDSDEALEEFKRAEAFLEANGPMVKMKERERERQSKEQTRPIERVKKLSLSQRRPIERVKKNYISQPRPLSLIPLSPSLTLSLSLSNKQLGLSPPLSALDSDSAALLLESYDADPSWAAKGPARVQKPAPLLAGCLVIELFDADAPRACANFRALCTGEKGLSKSCKKPLHYKGTVFHRIITGFICQGGDFVRGDGSGAESVFGGKFKDEPAALKRRHDAPGVVGMANSGKNGNGCQFYVTLAAAPQCDGKHVVVGKVVEGLEILERIASEAASEGGVPRVRVAVADCGVCE